MSATHSTVVKDYTEYYKLIIEAEHFFFMESKADSALLYYDSAFAAYNYVFIQDVLNAAQISIHTVKGEPKIYIVRAFRQGLQFKHFKDIPLLAPLEQILAADSSFVRSAEENRAHYLQNINYSYLSKIYDLAIVEQIHKGDPSPEIYTRRRLYLDTLRSWIETFGFPGVKILGIEDTEAFAAIDKPRADFRHRVVRHYPKIAYFKLSNDLFAAHLPLVILVHNKCAFDKLELLLRRCMLKGEIHPREIGMLYDNTYRWSKLESVLNDCEMPPPEAGLFMLNIFLNYKQYDNKELTDELIDILRAKWYIGKIAVDRKKHEFNNKHGFKVSYGFWNSL